MITKSLGEIAEIATGFPFKSENFSSSDGVRLLRGDNIAQGRLRWENAAYWAGEAASHYTLADGDVVLAMDRPWIGAGLKLARVHQTDLPALLVQRVARFRAKSGVDQRFLEMALKDSSFSNYLQAIQTGTAVPHVSSNQIKEYKVRLPPIDEQERIAAVLGVLDDKIAANGALIQTVNDLAESVIRSHLIPGDSSRLEEIASVTMGSSPPGTSYNNQKDGLPFYQGVRDFSTRTPRERVWTTRPVRLAQPGNALVSVRAPVGRVNMAASPCCIGRGLAALQSSTQRPATLYHLVQLVDWAPFEAEGTIFGSINQQQLRALTVPVVVDPDQVESELAALEALIASHLEENRLLTELRNLLLPDLMSGRLKVDGAERQVDDAL